jgi:hypothetical protein
MVRFLMILVLFISCSPKVSYSKHSVRDNGGYERQKHIYKITKYNQRKMNKTRRKATNKKLSIFRDN